MRRALVLAGLVATPITAWGAPAASPVAPNAASVSGKRVRTVEVKTEDDLVLKADYYEASTKGQLVPAVLVVHDAGADRSQMEDVAERLQKGGFAVLSLDLRGHGQSKAKKLDWKILDEGQRSSLWAHATRDLEAASEWLRKQEGVHRTNLSLVGFGAGCALAVRHATRDENVRCVALISPNTKDFGFNVADDILEIEGLPTCVVATKTASEVGGMVKEANGSQPYIELFLCSTKSETPLQDRKTAPKVATWIKDCAMPRKGRK